MDGWLAFIVDRYNYWIVIILMMTGLYTVFARGNLVKKIVGLNLFQTSVFILYITIGKIAGGTAPIYVGGELDHEDGHGGPADGTDLHDAPANELPDAAGLHEKIDNPFADNDLKAALEALGPAEAAPGAPSLHDIPEDAGKISNRVFETMEKPEGLSFGAADGLHDGAGNALAEAAQIHGDIIYTNPLPHVLILTAIVVGVATTAVGLALAVRIREAYGTIEEDELDAIDRLAEFGAAAGEGAP
jgi:multicomponent Na+:H+ antiporter subunit C